MRKSGRHPTPRWTPTPGNTLHKDVVTEITNRSQNSTSGASRRQARAVPQGRPRSHGGLRNGHARRPARGRRLPRQPGGRLETPPHRTPVLKVARQRTATEFSGGTHDRRDGAAPAPQPPWAADKDQDYRHRDGAGRRVPAVRAPARHRTRGGRVRRQRRVGGVHRGAGPRRAVSELTRRLRSSTRRSRCRRDRRRAGGPRAEDGFVIVASTNAGGDRTLVPPDVATCDACLRELSDPATGATATRSSPAPTAVRGSRSSRTSRTTARRRRWPASRCANGAGRVPRSGRPPVPRPAHRLSDCGPTLVSLVTAVTITGADEAIAAAQRMLAEGGIVAVKGIGGYHLACRADYPETVTRLRERRPVATSPSRAHQEPVHRPAAGRDRRRASSGR